MRYAMIMAGGAGTRLWPVSRSDRPKQLVRFIPRRDPRTGETTFVSLLEIAAERLDSLVDEDRRYICTNEAYREVIHQTVPGFTDDRILGEPVGRDTVNAVGFAAAVLHKQDPDAVFCVLTADHLIEPVEIFRDRIDIGFRIAQRDPKSLVTFSIKPTYPATGFGYVERSDALPDTDGLGYRVERFVEKPGLERAQAYLESGVFAWNSGMFVWHAGTVLDCLRRYQPESYQGLMTIARAWGTPQQAKVLEQVYPTLPKISVDYAIMEPASREQSRVAGSGREAGAVRIATVEMDLDWLDVGSWPSFGETIAPDERGNRVGAAQGRTHLHECANTLVVNTSDDHHVAVLGTEDLIVVHTESATLVMPRDHAEHLKNMHAQLPAGLK